MEQSNDLLSPLRLSFHDERIRTFRHYSENDAYNDDQNGKEVNTDNNMPSDNLIEMSFQHDCVKSKGQHETEHDEHLPINSEDSFLVDLFWRDLLYINWDQSQKQASDSALQKSHSEEYIQVRYLDN